LASRYHEAGVHSRTEVGDKQPEKRDMDQILVWNGIALEADRVSHTAGGEQHGPVLSSRALAIVHLALYDAFAGARGNPAHLPVYLPGLPAAPAGANPDEAAAAAAYTALVALYPSQLPSFAAALPGGLVSPSHHFGAQVAQALLLDRNADPDAGAAGYAPPVGRGKHQVDPENPGQGFYAPFYGARSKGFAVSSRHGLNAPPNLTTIAYRDALRMVRAKGIKPELAGALPASLGSRQRTADQTLTGVYWAYDNAVEIGTPPRHYNQIIRQVAIKQGNSPEENARLFALVNAALADAAILAWDQKYLHDLWRPVVGIRQHDQSLGPTAEPNDHIDDDSDTEWLPFGAPNSNRMTGGRNFTPNFPAYPSGHATFGAAAFQMTRLFYGEHRHHHDPLFRGLASVSDELDGVTRDANGVVRPRHLRSFPDGLWQMIEENARSRVYLGVHWIFDAFAVEDQKPDLDRNIGGVPLGLRIAEDIFGGGRSKGLKKSPVMPRVL
jgi:hypothetical protein